VSPVNKILEVRRLGLVPYEEGLALQRDLVEARRRDEIPTPCCSCSILPSSRSA